MHPTRGHRRGKGGTTMRVVSGRWRSGARPLRGGRLWLPVLLILVLAGAHGTTAPVPAGAATGPVSVRVQGNHLVSASGATVRLLGVSRSGTEFMCVKGNAIFDGPS